jgi:tetratricopeptide (TPR) repeat protein
MIVKNEEANLGACLESAADLVDEIIIVDTGSTDQTKAIAERFGAHVFDFPWVDSFAAARNESLNHATGDWIFWLDADDRLDEQNRQKLRVLFAELRQKGVRPLEERGSDPFFNVAYNMKCLCLPDPVGKTATMVDHVRLFRNHPKIRWQFRVHEQILPAVREMGGEVRWSDVVIHHAGYQDPALRRRKLERDLRLLQLEDADTPDHPFTLFNLGSVFMELGRHAAALPLLQRSLQRSHPSDSIVRKLYALLVQCHRQLGQGSEALAACQAGRGHYPDDAELLFQEALVRREQKDFAGAEACFLRLLEHREGAHFASIDTGLRGYKARHNLAVIYHEQGRWPEAEAQWRAALAEQPGFGPAWLGLGELHLAQKRWPEVDEVCGHLANGLQMEMEAAVLRARGHLGRQHFAAARALLEETIAQRPDDLLPRIVLSHAMLQEGKDWHGAEQALHDVLRLDPDNIEAQRNLSLLRCLPNDDSFQTIS